MAVPDIHLLESSKTCFKEVTLSADPPSISRRMLNCPHVTTLCHEKRQENFNDNLGSTNL